MFSSKTITISVLAAAAAMAVPALPGPAALAALTAISPEATRFFKKPMIRNANRHNRSQRQGRTIAKPVITADVTRPAIPSPGPPILAAVVGKVGSISTMQDVVTDPPLPFFAGDVLQPKLSAQFSLIGKSPANSSDGVDGLRTNRPPGHFIGFGLIDAQLHPWASTTPGGVAGRAIDSLASDFLAIDHSVDGDFTRVVASNALPRWARLFTGSPATSGIGTPRRVLWTFPAANAAGFLRAERSMVSTVPEPEMWMLGLAGFGMVGLQLRRRATAVTLVAA